MKTGTVKHEYTEIPNPGFSSFPVTYPTTTKSTRVSLGFPSAGLGLLNSATSSSIDSAASSSDRTLIDLTGESSFDIEQSVAAYSGKKPRVEISDVDIDIDLTADSESDSEECVAMKKEY